MRGVISKRAMSQVADYSEIEKKTFEGLNL